MDQTQAAPEAHITYYGGKWVAFAPILLAIVGLIYIAVKQADVPEYWVVFLLPMIVCLFLAKDKTAYCEAIIEGATNKVGGILIMAVLLAGICGQLIETSGLVAPWHTISLSSTSWATSSWPPLFCSPA